MEVERKNAPAKRRKKSRKKGKAKPIIPCESSKDDQIRTGETSESHHPPTRDERTESSSDQQLPLEEERQQDQETRVEKDQEKDEDLGTIDESINDSLRDEPAKSPSLTIELKNETSTTYPHKVDVVYEEAGPLYLDLRANTNGKGGAVVKGFRRKQDKSMGAAEASGCVFPEDLLVAINHVDVAKKPFATIIHMAKTTPPPVTLTFQNPKHEAKLSSFQEKLKSPTTSWKAFRKTALENLSTTTESPGATNISPVFRKWQGKLSLDQVKSSSSDGMKSLWNNMMGRTQKSNEDEMLELAATVRAITYRQNERFHTAEIELHLPNGNVISPQDEILVEWYRELPNGQIVHLDGLTTARYQPSIDDVDCKICAQVQAAKYEQFYRMIEIGPIVMDPSIHETLENLVESGCGLFSATLLTSEDDSFQLRVSDESVSLLKINEETADTGILQQSEYREDLQIHLDVVNTCRFTLQFADTGRTLGGDKDDTCDVHSDNTDLARVELLAQNATNRDIIALIIRRFRKLAIDQDKNEVAIKNEMRYSEDEDSQDSATIFPEEKAETGHDHTEKEELTEEIEQPAERGPEINSSVGLVNLDDMKEQQRLNVQELNSLREQYTTRTNELKTTQEECSMLSIANEHRDDQINELKSTLKLKEQELERMEDQMMFFKQKSLESQAIAEKIQALEKDNQSLLQQLKQQQKRTEQCRLLHQEAQQDYQVIHDQNEQLRNELVESQNHRLDAMNESKALRTKVETLTRQLTRLVGNGRSIDDVEEDLQRYEQLIIDHAVTRAHMKHLKDELNEYQFTFSTMKSESEHDQSNFLGLTNVNAIKTRLQHVQRHNEELQQLTRTLTIALAEKEDQIRHLETK